ncbi:MAG: hypothetical protein ACE15B_14345 [Bryobacteraceae bacterium]
MRLASGAWYDLGTLGGGSGTAYAINDLAAAVGSSITSTGQTHAFLWTPAGGIRDIGTLPGGTYSEAYAINIAGVAVGRSNLSGSPYMHAFAWRNGTPMWDLGAAAEGASEARGINTWGHVAGAWTAPGGTSKAVLWVRGYMIDLNLLLPAGSGWELTDARAVNDSLQIAGNGMHNGKAEGFLLKPPAGAALPPPAIPAQ